MPLVRLGHVTNEPADVTKRQFKMLPWVDETAKALKSYLDEQPSAEEIAKVVAYELDPIDYFHNPHIRVRSIENEAGHMFRNFIQTLELNLDEETARKVSYAAGLSHGKRRMGTFLSGHGLTSGPETMAKLQDFGHATAGPRHTTALFARYDDELVEVVRTEDSYGAHTGEESEVMKAFFDGLTDGYRATDPSISRIEELTRPGPNGGTEFVHRFWFTPAAGSDKN